MKTVKGHALVNKACDEVKQIMLLEMTNEAQEELTHEQKVYKSLQEKKLKTMVEKQALRGNLQNEFTCMREKCLNLHSSLNHFSNPPSTDKITVKVECRKTNGVTSIDGWLYSIETFPSM